MVVEKLLELFVTEVDADLFEGIEFKNLKACDVKDADEVDLWGENDDKRCRSTFFVGILTFHGRINEGTVAEVDKPKEESVVHGSGQGSHGVEAVVCVLSLVHPLSTDLDLGTDEVAVEELPILNKKELADFLAWLRVVHLAALFASLLLERHLSKVGNRGGQLEGVSFFLCTEAKGVESNISELQFLGIINGIYLDLPLREAAIINVRN